MVPEGGRQTHAACIRDVGSTQNFLLLAKRQTKNESIKELLGTDADIVQLDHQRRLMYFEHIVRMDGRRFLYIILYGRLHGTRPRGRSNKRWLENIRDDCVEMELTITAATRLARDRSR